MGLKAFSRLGLYFLLAWTVTGAAAQQAVRLDLGWSATPSSEILPETPHPQTANSQSANSQSDTPSPAPEGTGQGAAPPSSGAPGSIHGVVTNLDGAVYEGAHIALALAAAPTGETVRQTASDSSGRFNFDDVPPGTFKLTVSAAGFAPQALVGTLHSAESYEAKAFTLAIGSTTADVEVTASTAEIAQAQLKEEETQRIFAIIPNFYVAYAPHAAPLSPRQKFSLAWKTLVDPATFLITAGVAGAQQATNSLSGYGQGTEGYAKRYGAGLADGAIGTMLGGAILPVWWKQDPRYFYQGTGSKRSRVLHAIAWSVICNGDNGHRQVNYSAIIGGLAAGGISNLYYPASDRSGVGVTFENAIYGTLSGAATNLLQEFVVRRLTPKVPNYAADKQ